MQNIEKKLDEAIEIMYENNCMLKLMQGYCLHYNEEINGLDCLVNAFEGVMSNQRKLWNKIDDINGDVFRAANPNLFK